MCLFKEMGDLRLFSLLFTCYVFYNCCYFSTTIFILTLQNSNSDHLLIILIKSFIINFLSFIIPNIWGQPVSPEYQFFHKATDIGPDLDLSLFEFKKTNQYSCFVHMATPL